MEKCNYLIFAPGISDYPILCEPIIGPNLIPGNSFVDVAFGIQQGDDGDHVSVPRRATVDHRVRYQR